MCYKMYPQRDHERPEGKKKKDFIKELSFDLDLEVLGLDFFIEIGEQRFWKTALEMTWLIYGNDEQSSYWSIG